MKRLVLQVVMFLGSFIYFRIYETHKIMGMGILFIASLLFNILYDFWEEKK